MPNSTMFSDDELRLIEKIAKDLREQAFSEVKIKDTARYFYIHLSQINTADGIQLQKRGSCPYCNIL